MRHKLFVRWEDGPLDPDELLGYYDDSECLHDDYNEETDENVCPTCNEELD
jgi:hypothetical protein